MPLNFGATKAGFLGCLVLAAASRAPAESHDISFHLNEPGQVSIAVYDEQGIMFRELARGIKMDAGEHRLLWDGLDRYGQPAPAGSYEWRLLETPGFTREFLVNVGTNPGWTPFDLWPGNHTGPTSLMVDADTNLYVAAISSEGPPRLIKMSADGKEKFWDSRQSGLRDGLIGMARIGELVYLLFNTGAVDILNAGSGNRLSMPQVRSAPPPAFPDFIHPDDADAQKQAKYRRNVSPMAFAGGKDFLVVSYQAHDEIRFFWPKDEVIVRTNSIHLAAPQGCCVAPDGRVFVVSGKSVVRVNPETGEVLPVVTDPELTSPTRIAYDPVNDDLLVVEHGENLDNVRRYHAADGKLIAVYGRPAGRTYGAFNPMDWGVLLDVAADNQGGFFTVEAFPRRVAHFSGRGQPELVAQWFGGTQWGALCVLDPADPTIVYLFPDSRHCARGRIDYTTRTWTLTHLYDLPEGFSWVSGATQHREMFPNFGGESYWEVRHVAGQTFLVNNGEQQGGCAAVVRVDEQNNRLVPVAILGGLHPTLDRVTPPPWWLAAMKQAGYDPKRTGYNHFAFSWSDTNRNGRIDVGEIKLGSVGGTYAESHCFVDPQWNVYCALNLQPPRTDARARHTNTKAVKSSIWTVVTNEGDLQMPIWNWDHAHPAEAAFPQSETVFAATFPFGIFHDRHGNTYTVCNARTDPHKADVPPLTWPNNKTFASRFQKWNANGVLEWSVGVHTAAQDRPPGEFAQVRGILGELHDCLVVVDACDPASVWTRDGLFAGSLYGQRADDGLPDLAYTEIHHADNHWGQILETPQGDILWGGMSDNSTLIYRIHGWDNWQHQSGNITIQQPSHPALWKGGGLKAEYFTNADLNGIPELQRLDPEIWFGPMWGNHQHIRPWRSLPNFQSSTTNIQAQMSVRWTGFLEAPLSESFTFVIYTYGHPLRNGLGLAGGRVRLWVNGQLVIDQWDGVKQENVPAGKTQTRACVSQPVVLTAGKLVPIRLEYAGVGGDNAQLHLFFSSDSIDLRHVPQMLFYPDMPNPPAK